MRVPPWLRRRRTLIDERDAALASGDRWREEFDAVGTILCQHGYHAHEGWGVLASDVRQALGAVAAREREKTCRLDEVIETARRVLLGAGHDVTDETAFGEDVDLALTETRHRTAHGILSRVLGALGRSDPGDTSIVEAEVLADVAGMAGLTARGLRIDGDMLRDAIADCVPRTITDHAARAFAEQVLDRLVIDGVTVLHGPDLTPRPMREIDADRLGEIVEVPAQRTDGDDVPTELRALAREMHRWAPDGNALTIRDRLLDAARWLDATPSRLPLAQCPASGHRSGRCRGVAGHPGAHEWAWQR